METKYGPYSSSRLDTAACPHRFNKQYIEKSIKEVGSEESRRGNVVHETFEKITAALIQNKPLNWKEALKILTQNLAKYSITSREDKLLCLNAVKAYMENPPSVIDTIFGIEEHLAVKYVDGKFVECDYNDPTAYYRGKIDILSIDGTRARIIDHKTQPYIEKEANTFQMGGYAWLVSIHYPQITEIESVLHYCRAELNFYSKPYLWSKEDIKNIEAEIKMEISVAETMVNFPANPNFYCKYCPCQLECPVLHDLKSHATALGDVKKGPLMSATEAVKAAGELNVAEEAVSKIKSHLQNFVKTVGPVHIHGKEYSFSVTDSYDVKKSEDKKAIMEILGDAGADPYSFIKIDIEKLKKSWTKLSPEQLSKIKVHLSPKKSTSFRGKKA